MSRVSVTKPAGRATALVLSTVRAAILSGELSPGEQIRQQVWADRTGVSRPPLREALEILTNEGLLVHGLNQGYFVAKFNRDEMEQLYTMRLLLEREALEEIEWPTDAQLAELENVADDIEQHARSGRPDIALQELAEFYLGIYELSPKKLIVEEVKRLWIRTAAYRSLSVDVSADPGRSGQRLHVIVDVLRARDLPRLRELLLRPTLRGRSGVAVGGHVMPSGADERRVAG
ncbi:GntR family transcriptional regulator [Pseudonocardia alaniniphila]|uniref:GntR family transcriptional regulator n=1 Tax=Pseudonocardia alaniniphila TaxID=75291 RepID=A0ABS9TQQ7_9PSEU|nr:GntR family transcriptional regulator [Pseudonocardia alaniniphila]MCH6170877.1 GntR family transcriptional regulator [Pseudonocardia alaniniphila]